MVQDGSRRLNWARLPLIATIARVLCREVTLEAEYFRVQYEVVRSKVPGRIRFTDEERRRLVDAALAMGRKAMRSVVSIVKPETILAWQRRLEQKKWDYSRRRRRGPGRQGPLRGVPWRPAQVVPPRGRIASALDRPATELLGRQKAGEPVCVVCTGQDDPGELRALGATSRGSHSGIRSVDPRR